MNKDELIAMLIGRIEALEEVVYGDTASNAGQPRIDQKEKAISLEKLFLDFYDTGKYSDERKTASEVLKTIGINKPTKTQLNGIGVVLRKYCGESKRSNGKTLFNLPSQRNTGAQQMNKETSIQNAILLALSKAGCTVWRVETSGAWVGKVIHKDAGGTITIRGARMIKSGLCSGGSDIIGLTSDGRFLAVEVKTATGRASKEQENFIRAVNESGGIAGICRSPQDALELLSRS